MAGSSGVFRCRLQSDSLSDLDPATQLLSHVKQLSHNCSNKASVTETVSCFEICNLYFPNSCCLPVGNAGDAQCCSSSDWQPRQPMGPQSCPAAASGSVRSSSQHARCIAFHAEPSAQLSSVRPHISLALRCVELAHSKSSLGVFEYCVYCNHLPLSLSLSSTEYTDLNKTAHHHTVSHEHAMEKWRG